MPAESDLPLVGTSPVVAAAVLIALVMASIPLIRRIAGPDDDAGWMRRVLWLGLGAHLVGALAQVIVVDLVYGGVADYVGYQSKAAFLAQSLRSLSWPKVMLDLPGDDSVSVVAAAFYLVVPPDQLGGFLFFAWLAFLGLAACWRALRVALPLADHRRYALLLFFFPSLAYWPSATGKESLMMVAIGLTALGSARLLARERHSAGPLVAGLFFAVCVRPHVAVLLIGALAVAYLARRAEQRSLLTPLRWTAMVVLLGLGSFVVIIAASRFLGLDSLSPESLVAAVETVNQDTVEEVGGSTFENEWSPSPLRLPVDTYIVLFKPLPWEVSGSTQLIAASENVLLIAVLLLSVGRLLRLPGQLRKSPYVLQAAAYSLGFIYIFSAIGNLGLLVRERSMLFPVLFVLLVATPAADRRDPRARPRPAVEPSRRIHHSAGPSAAQLLR